MLSSAHVKKKKKDEKMIVSNNFIEVNVLSFQHVISIRN